MNTTSKSKKFLTVTQFHDFDFRDSVKVATSNSTDANGLYNYLTTSGSPSSNLKIDGQSVPFDSRILVKDLQNNSATKNGIWIYSSVSQWTRANDFDDADEIRKGVVVPVELGTKNAATQWVVGNMTDSGGENVSVWTSSTRIKFTDIVSRDLAALPERPVDTTASPSDNVVFLHEDNTCTGYEAYQGSFVSLMISQANSQGSGSGLIVDNGHFGVNVDGNVLVIESRDITGDGDPPTGDVADNYNSAYNSNQKLIRISNSSIKNKKLHTPFISLSDGINIQGSVSLGHTLHISGVTDTGLNCSVSGNTFTLSNSPLKLSDGIHSPGSVSLGDTLHISGYIDTGLNCSVSGNTFSLSNDIATNSDLGVAKFSSTNFSVSNGSVSIKDQGVSNNNLVNSGISLSDGIHSSSNLSLGQTLIISGVSDTGFNCSVSGNTFSLSNDIATNSDLGVAKFSSTNFSVSSNGQVDIKNGGVTNNNLVSSGISLSDGINNNASELPLGQTLIISGVSDTGLNCSVSGNTFTLSNSPLKLSNGINSSGSVSLNETLIISGDTSTGLNCSVSGNTFSLSNSKATNSDLGVAKFSSTNFSVSSNGQVDIKNGGVSNNNLVSSGITFTGNSSTTISLGNNLNISLNSQSDGISLTPGNLNIITVSSGTISESNSITISKLFYVIDSGGASTSLGIMLNGSKYYIALNSLSS